MEIWLDLLLCCKNGGRSLEGRIARPAFESVWSVDVIGFTPDQGSSTGSTGFQVIFKIFLFSSNFSFELYLVQLYVFLFETCFLELHLENIPNCL